MEVDAFHQQPVAVGHDTVLHHHESDAAANHRLQCDSEVSLARWRKAGSHWVFRGNIRLHFMLWEQRKSGNHSAAHKPTGPTLTSAIIFMAPIPLSRLHNYMYILYFQSGFALVGCSFIELNRFSHSVISVVVTVDNAHD